MSRAHALFLTVSGLRTHAWVRGEGLPLVVVPGLGCASWMYIRLARELARARTVYVYDPPGHGASEGRPGSPRTIEELTDHLAAWLDAANLGQVPIFGHSLGGEVAFDLAARYPSRVSAVIACAPTGIPENPRVPEQIWRLLGDLPRERPQLYWPGLQAYARCGLATMLRLAGDQARHETGPLLSQVRAPTLLIDGSADHVIQSWTVQAICDAIPDATTRMIPGGPHALTDSHPRAVARYTLDFLAELRQ